MQNPVTSTSHSNNTIPFPTAHTGPGVAPSAAEPAPHAAETPAGASRGRGRPSGYAPRIIDMMCGDITVFGLSDSAAAESVGMSSSTISRWKQQFPELEPKLTQARQECRKYHLRNIQKHADSDKAGPSLRASMWILERVFPEDYARTSSERTAARQAQERRREREALEYETEQIKERLAVKRAEQAEAKRQAAATESAGSAAATAADAENRASTFEGDSHNSRNSGEGRRADSAEQPAPAQPPTPDSCMHSEEASHNSRNSGAEEAPAVRASVAHSVTASHNSRNSGEPKRKPEPTDLELARAQAWHIATQQDPSASQYYTPAQELAFIEILLNYSAATSHNSRNSEPGAVLPERVAPSGPVF